MTRTSPAVTGLVLAVAVCAVAAALPRPLGRDLLAALLAATASVYAGAALAGGRRDTLLVETVAFVAVLTAALAGLWRQPAALAAGYLAHAAWDWLHHEGIGARTGRRFPQMCLVFDLAVGGFALFLYL